MESVVSELRSAAAHVRPHYFDDEPSSPDSDRFVALRLLQHAEASESSSSERHALADMGETMLASAAAAMLAASSSSVDDGQAVALEAWCDRFLPARPCLRLQHFEQTGRGVASTRGIVQGEEVLRIPESLLLTADRVMQHPIIGPAVMDTSPEDILLALALLREPILDPDGAWAKYMPFLPAKPPGALLWSDYRLHRMSATPLTQQTHELKDALRDAYASLFPRLSVALPKWFPAEAFTWERFLWAYAMVESRGLMLELAPGRKRTVLVPFADMLNHSPSAALAWPILCADSDLESRAAAASNALPTGVVDASLDGQHARGASETDDAATYREPDARTTHPPRSLVFRALRRVAKGEEVSLYYGRLSCLQTLQYYGFVDPAQLAHEVVQIDLDFVDEEVSLPLEVVEAHADADDEEALQALAMKAASDQRRLREQLMLAPQLLAALRILLLSADELQALTDQAPELANGDPKHAISIANETRCCEALRSIIDGLAESIASAAAASMAHSDGTKPGTGQPRDGDGAADEANHEHDGDPCLDEAIDAYIQFHRRVMWHTMRCADNLEARLAAMGSDTAPEADVDVVGGDDEHRATQSESGEAGIQKRARRS